MPFTPHLYGAASLATLVVAVLFLLNARGRGTAATLLLFICLFVWTGAEWLHRLRGDRAWLYAALFAVSWIPAGFLHLCFRIVPGSPGERAFRAVYVAGGLFAALPIAAGFAPAVARFVDGWGWNAAYLAFLAPCLAYGSALLLHGARQEPHAGRRHAIRWILAASAIAAAASITDLTYSLIGHGLRLGAAGALAGAILFTIGALRERFLGVDLRRGRITTLALLAFAAPAAFLAAVALDPARWGVLAAAALGLSIFLIAAFQRLLWAAHEESDRLRRLAALGALAGAVAHEVRNPLAAMRGALQLLEQDSPLSPRGREHLELLRAEIDALHGTVENVQLLARPPEPRLQRVDIDRFVERLAEVFRPQAPHRVSLVVERNGAVPAAKADPDALRHALWNLLKNAAEASPPAGEVRLRAGASPEGVRIEVLDSGPGIPPEELERIAEPLHSSKPWGSGLGLAVARHLVGALGGTLTIENRAEGGLRAAITLPREAT